MPQLSSARKAAGGPFQGKNGRSGQTAPMQTIENSYALLSTDRQTSTANTILWQNQHRY